MKTLPLRMLLLAAVATRAMAANATTAPPTVWGADEMLPRRHLGPEARAGYLAAAALLQQKLIALRIYPHIGKRCLAFELYDIEGKTYYFAARGICSSSPSSLLDRYQVDMKLRRTYLFDELKETYSRLPDHPHEPATLKQGR